MNIEINKCKLREGMFLDYGYTETTSDNLTNSIDNECSAIVHEDLQASLRKFKPFVALLLGLTEDLLKDDSPELANISIQSVDFGNRNTLKLGVKYYMQYISDSANINLPKIDFTAHKDLIKAKRDHQGEVLNDDNEPISTVEKLKLVADLCYTEVYSYHTGKYGAGTQLSIGLDGGITDVIIEEKPKRSRGKKPKAEPVSREEDF